MMIYRYMHRLLYCQLGLIVALFLIGSLTACRSGGKAGDKTLPQRYTEFAQRLAQAVNERDADFFNAYFDFDALVDEITERVEAPQEYKDGFRAGIKQQLNVGGQMVGSLGADGAYRFLHLKNETDNPMALFRLTTADGINYHEIKLGVRGDSCYIKDFYIYRGGVDFSATLKMLYFSSLVEVSNDSVSFDNTASLDRAFVENLPRIEEIAALTEAKQYRNALLIADSLPEVLRNDKMILVMRTNIAYHVGQTEFEQTLADFRHQYPADAVVEFIALDLAFESQQPKLILQRIDELDAKLAGDPYLNVLRAGVYEAQNDTTTAETLYRKAIAGEPDNEEIPFRLCLFFIKNQQYEAATALFTDIYDQFKYNAAEFFAPDENKGFWLSKAYKTWEKEHPLEQR